VKIETVGVVGLGLLGRGIVACLLSRGLKVVAHTRSEQTRAEATQHVAHAIDELVSRGGVPAQLREQWRDRLINAAALDEFAACDFIIESVIEDLQAKQTLFEELEKIVKPDTPIASNTSALPITLLQQGRNYPRRFIGMHWAEPCHLTRFLEVVRGEQTDERTADAAVALGKSAGKEPSLVQKDVEGFIANRLGYALYREAFWLLENGVADIETIDRSFCNAISVWGNIAGPFRWMDMTGLPAYAAVMRRLWPQLSCAKEVPRLMTELVDSGARGISNGRGFYEYTEQEASRWQRLLVENVWKVRELYPEEQA
jgi:3-hydroxybutyryl-CoA dehydrogenase